VADLLLEGASQGYLRGSATRFATAKPDCFTAEVLNAAPPSAAFSFMAPQRRCQWHIHMARRWARRG